MQIIRFGNILFLNSSCKCLSPPPYLEFTLSPMYKIKLKRKGKKKLTISTSWSSLLCIIGTISFLSGRYWAFLHTSTFCKLLSSSYRADITLSITTSAKLQLSPSLDQLWCLLSSSYRADTNIIEHLLQRVFLQFPSLLEPSGWDVSKQTTPILVVCNELIVCSLKT